MEVKTQFDINSTVWVAEEVPRVHETCKCPECGHTHTDPGTAGTKLVPSKGRIVQIRVTHYWGNPHPKVEYDVELHRNLEELRRREECLWESREKVEEYIATA